MMAMKDMTMVNEPQGTHPRPGVLWPTVIILGTVFLMGGVAGYLDAHRADGGDGPSGLVAGGLVLLAGTVVMWLYLRRFGAFWQGWSRRKRLYTASVAGSGLLGFVTAILLRSGQSDVTADPFFSNSALSPQIAIGLALLWGVGISIAIFIYQRTIDDHEQRAYLWAGLAGYYAFVIPAPMWWVLSRADLAPPVNAMLLFLLTVAANALVYMWLKFR
ncbi:MAG TPA: hypothetical protein VGN68_17715 [Sphingopyxis sp.]|uniref:hypothetical protein n=1 Tax=Sphingopyxis sp. TaxID=1908224 RepID=UPI002E1574F1|nr:hypothetical protein [Sphingopyxis sp.]